MFVTKRTSITAVAVLILSLPISGRVKEKKPATKETGTGPAVLWREPQIEGRDLFYGPGGKEHAPRGPFAFVKEELGGTNPKFVVRDADGQEWKVKLGIEARPETAASRIVWSVGYYADEDYLIPELRVSGMPAKLHRGKKLVGPDGSMQNARLEREIKNEAKLGNWEWRHDAFTGTRELNGLRVLMAVINNWDLKDVNNAIYQVDGERIYAVSDLGSSFGPAGRSWPRDKTKGDLDRYERSRFIRNVTASTVDFQCPARPRYVYLVGPKEYLARVHLEWIGKNIPRTDALWMGHLLARLSPKQVRDAFRAAGYSEQQTEGFASVLEKRIAALTDL
jgi:hypothetical protein